MLLRLLLLRWLSPAVFRLVLIFAGLLFLAFAGECVYLMFHSLTHPSPYRPIHSSGHRR
jgi:hypothetical protein